MDPYHVLGVPPTADTSEAELAYRRLLRAWHPDLHQGRGPDAVAEAEAATRQLNEAIGLIRAGWRPDPWSLRSATDFAWQPTGSEPWTGGDEPVPCPFCGRPFSHLTDYQAHLRARHQVRMGARSPTGSSNQVVRIVGSLRYIPPWLVLAVWVGLLFLTPPIWWPVPLVFLMLVLWTQVSPRFRGP